MKFNEESGEDVKPICITKEARDTCPVNVAYSTVEFGGNGSQQRGTSPAPAVTADESGVLHQTSVASSSVTE